MLGFEVKMIEMVKFSLEEAKEGLVALLENEETLESIVDAAKILANTIANGGRVFSCGNGGSMCDAMHFAEELTGRYRGNRRAFSAIAISDPSHMSCVANDYGYQYVFSRYIEGNGREGDCLMAISTSGTSESIVLASKAAKEIGMKVIGLTGRHGAQLESCIDIKICTPAGNYADRVQELNIKVLHIIIQLIEQILAE